MEKQNRPVDLPLLKIRLPIGGIVSIIHRITGVLLVLLLPLAIYWWDQSLSSRQGFDRAVAMFEPTWVRILWLVLVAMFIQHLVSGVRHLLLDLHVWIEKPSARATAWAVPAITLVLVGIAAGAMFG